MREKSVLGPALVSAAGLVVLVIALVFTLVPMTTNGTAVPTGAFRAQQRLDDIAFELGSSPGARYSGTLTTTAIPDGAPRTVRFHDLVVASTKNAQGAVTFASHDAQYRQIGNYRYINGPAEIWSALFGGAPVLRQLDLAPTANKWSDLRFSGLPDLGLLLSPTMLAGRIGNTEQVEAPEPGPVLPAPNRGLPDARFWPTGDPPITAVGDDGVRVGAMETTFDPSTHKVTHIKGEFTRAGTRVSLDTDVTPLAAADLGGMFDDERSLVPSLISVPAPGVPLAADDITTSATGVCTTAACPFTVVASGAVDPGHAADMRGVAGHINYGLTVKFAVDAAAPGAVGGTCGRVVSVPFGGRTEIPCAATNLPPGTQQVKPETSIRYLPFVDLTEDGLRSYIDSQEKAVALPIAMVRTGAKTGDAARYNDQEAGLPSSYAVRQGDYLFDGVGPEGNLFVSFGPGYADHVTAGRFDPNWPGTEQLRSQLTEQMAAAGDRRITYVSAEPETAAALGALATESGADPARVQMFSVPLADN
ncbi:hypothetical protein AAFP35_12520 [Gordonia sp. CPCC 206044]|uniref:hypothetical protein n=1 Tax=Gordonia sp. CPCC 206044 TaxID=3140793 RepID=UPI003AF33F55